MMFSSAYVLTIYFISYSGITSYAIVMFNTIIYTTLLLCMLIIKNSDNFNYYYVGINATCWGVSRLEFVFLGFMISENTPAYCRNTMYGFIQLLINLLTIFFQFITIASWENHRDAIMGILWAFGALSIIF